MLCYGIGVTRLLDVRDIATDTGAASWEAKLPGELTALQLSPDGQLAIAGDSNGNVRAIASDTGAALWEAGLPRRISALQLSPDGQLSEPQGLHFITPSLPQGADSSRHPFCQHWWGDGGREEGSRAL